MKRQRGRGQGSLYKRNSNGCWIASWYDHDGKRRTQTTRTTDKAAADRILNKRVSDASLRREGVIDARKDRFAIEGRKPLADHAEQYIEHCRRIGQDTRNVDQKERHLQRLREVTGIQRLSDLTADSLEHYMKAILDKGRSARTANHARQIAVAFASWCVRMNRLESNPLKVVERLDEQRDRRRERRALTDDELARLMEVAEQRGRKAWYPTAVLAGLRKGDLQRLKWCDIDFNENTITIREGKAKRVDVIPLHSQLADELRKRQAASLSTPQAKVFPQTVTDRTRLGDFLRAGLAREEVIVDDNGKPVMTGKGKRQRPKTRIVTEDADGRVIDLHAMRTTLGTKLARQGVPPQITQRIMRHSDYRTTDRHYTVLGLTDTSQAIESIPGIVEASDTAIRATGTDGNYPVEECQQLAQQLGQQLGCNHGPTVATDCDEHATATTTGNTKNTMNTGGSCLPLQPSAIMHDQHAGVAQLVERQLPKLNVVSSSLITRFNKTSSTKPVDGVFLFILTTLERIHSTCNISVPFQGTVPKESG